jgi:hypothetical protein
MPDPDFVTEVLTTEVVVNHLGHIFRFPIMPNGTVSLNGSRIEPNPEAKQEARRYLFDAHDAARSAFDRAAVQDLTEQGPRERIDDVFLRQRVSAPFETIS